MSVCMCVHPCVYIDAANCVPAKFSFYISMHVGWYVCACVCACV